MKVKQMKKGRQERPYADHIYLWEIKTDKPANIILSDGIPRTEKIQPHPHPIEGLPEGFSQVPLKL